MIKITIDEEKNTVLLDSGGKKYSLKSLPFKEGHTAENNNLKHTYLERGCMGVKFYVGGVGDLKELCNIVITCEPPTDLTEQIPLTEEKGLPRVDEVPQMPPVKPPKRDIMDNGEPK